MTTLATRAEILKLEHLCRLNPGSLDSLAAIPAEDIRQLREAVQDSLFDGKDAGLLKRLAKAGALLPLGLVSMMAQKLFGPVLGARVAGEMSPQRAVALAARLPDEFLADLSVELDPGRARDLLHALPAERIRDVAAVLLEREEYVAMGRFVGYLSRQALGLTMDEAFTDPGDMLRVAFFVEGKSCLGDLFDLMSDARLLEIILAAQGDTENLWPEAVALMADLDDNIKRKLGDMVAGQSDEVLAGLVDTAHRQQLWGDVLPVVARMSRNMQRHVGTLPQLCDEKLMRGILTSVDENELWADLLPLIDTMGEAQLKTMASVATRDLPSQALGRALAVANSANKWDTILTLAGEMTAAQLANVGAAAEALPHDAIPGLLLMADEKDLWGTVLPVAAGLSKPLRKQVAAFAVMATPEMRQRIVDAARASPETLWPALLASVVLIPARQRAGFAQTVAECVRKEPALVERLAPAASASGLDDLLAVARRAIAAE